MCYICRRPGGLAILHSDHVVAYGMELRERTRAACDYSILSMGVGKWKSTKASNLTPSDDRDATNQCLLHALLGFS